ncbi:hypothetical protein JCM9279_000989 [Rhodotorula babjevae]
MAQPTPTATAAPSAAPFVPRLLESSFALEGDYRIRFSVDVKLNILEPRLSASLPLRGVPLPGNWALMFQREAVGDDVQVNVQHGVLAEGDLGDNVKVTVRVCWVGGGWSSKVADGSSGPAKRPRRDPKDGSVYPGYRATITPSVLEAAANKSAGAFDPAKHRHYRISFELNQTSIFPERPARKELARRIPDFSTGPGPSAVRLFFPAHDDCPAAELWTAQHLLTSSSPYFRTLFKSGLAECIPVAAQSAQKEASAAVLVDGPVRSDQDFDDSDDETDDFIFERDEPSCALVTSEYKQVVITQAAYSTYCAVVLWLKTGYIAYAPISSSFSSIGTGVDGDTSMQSAAVTPTRRDALKAARTADRSLPSPVSPKSVYRLAHILELPELETHALRHFGKTCLTLETAPVELFSDLSRDHATWRAVILDWVVERYDEVKRTTAWKEVKRRVADNEIERVAHVLLELTDRLDELRGTTLATCNTLVVPFSPSRR